MASVKSTISITDDSQFADAGQGTVPLFFIATKQDKILEDSVSVASATTADTADVLQLVTSQADAVSKFGVPFFTEDSGTVQQGDELNEVGLWAMHSYLGIANRAYAVRADIDLAQLQPTAVEPTGDPVNGTFWFDTSTTEYGLFIANGNAVPGLAWDKVASIKIPTAANLTANVPNASYGADGNVALVTTTSNNFIYEKVSGAWYIIGSASWTAAKGGSATLTYSSHTSVPSGANAGSMWIKTTSVNDGVDWKLKLYSSSTGQFSSLTNNWYMDDLAAEMALGSSLSIGDVYTQYDPDGNGDAQQVFRKYGSSAAFDVTGTSANPTITAAESFDFTYNAAGLRTTITIALTGEIGGVAVTAQDINAAFATAGITARFEATETAITGGQALVISSLSGESFVLAENSGTPLADLGISVGQKSNFAALTYTASATAPTTAAPKGTLWYDESFKVDVLINEGTKWVSPISDTAGFDPEGVQVSSAKPTTQAAPGAGALTDADLWLDSSDLENYPALYRYSTALNDWVAIDKEDQTTPFGIIFDDARANAGPAYAGSTHVALSTDADQLAISDYVDPDAPDPQAYPAGMILFNTRYGTQNVKAYDDTYFGLSSSATFQLTGTTFTVGASATFDNPGESSNPVTARWVNESGNDLTGAMYGNRKAQRATIVKAMAASIANNDDVRSEFIEYSLLTAPGYVELLDELQTLNVDRKETALIVSDTPARLAPNGTDILNWATNINNAASNGEVARTTRYTYSTMSYPSMALGTNLDGSEVAVPGSAVKMRTIAYSDSVSYPWKPAAGLRRGVITNAASVGYITSENEYKPVILKEGLRDTLYDNAINPHAFLPDAGLVVWGDKTMHNTASALDRENVARLVVHIRTDLSKLVRPYFFELNNAATRADVKDKIDRYLADLVAKEAMYDFVTVVSEQNNTPTRIDRNELWIDIAIEPSKSINYIFIPIRIVNTGAL